MNKTNTIRRSVLGLALLAAVSSAGCFVNMMALPFFLFAPPPVIKPPIELVTSRRDHKKIVVIAHVENAIRFAFGSLEGDIESAVIREVNRNDTRIEVVPERKVRAWRDRNPNWIDASLQAVGEKFDVDYVVFLDISEFSLSDSKNQYLYQGRASVTIKVHDVIKDSVVFDQIWSTEYPSNNPVPMNEYASEDLFRAKFVNNLSRQISRHFVQHKVEDRLED